MRIQAFMKVNNVTIVALIHMILGGVRKKEFLLFNDFI